jgi:hypothetical protein
MRRNGSFSCRPHGKSTPRYEKGIFRVSDENKNIINLKKNASRNFAEVIDSGYSEQGMHNTPSSQNLERVCVLLFTSYSY